MSVWPKLKEEQKSYHKFDNNVPLWRSESQQNQILYKIILYGERERDGEGEDDTTKHRKKPHPTYPHSLPKFKRMGLNKQTNPLTSYPQLNSPYVSSSTYAQFCLPFFARGPPRSSLHTITEPPNPISLLLPSFLRPSSPARFFPFHTHTHTLVTNNDASLGLSLNYYYYYIHVAPPPHHIHLLKPLLLLLLIIIIINE